MLKDRERGERAKGQDAEGCMGWDDQLGRIEGEARPCPEDGICQELKQGTTRRSYQVLHVMERLDSSL